MEPHEDQQQPITAPENDKPEKKRRFQVVKLEERIAPDRGGKGTHNVCGSTGNCTEVCSSFY